MEDNPVTVFPGRPKTRFRLPEFKLKLSRGVNILIALLFVLVLAYNLFFVYVEPGEYGIKVNRIGLNRGVQKDIYHAGLTFVMPFGFQQIYKLPKGMQVLELTNFPSTASESA